MLAIGESKLVQGSAKEPYKVKNVDGTIYSCTCLGWKTSKGTVDQKTCKHVKAERSQSPSAPQAAPARGPAAPAAQAAPAPARATVGKAEVKVLLAEKWDGEDPTGWHVSEKLDGVRCLWDGERLLSRLGNEFQAPAWFIEALRDRFGAEEADGELWLGRKKFSECVSIVKSSRDMGWDRLTFMVFDLPKHGGPFEERMTALATLCPPVALTKAELAAQALGARFARIAMVPHVVCQGEDHLHRALAAVEKVGGEGLMLRRPGSLYERRRSSTLLKVKTFHDAEAVVLAHLPGKGKHTGTMGALHCRLASGAEFDVGTGFSDKERDAPPSIGSMITFRYQELSREGVPRFPSYLRLHHDV